MSNPKISVLIPVYNAEHTIQRCIRSILQQTFTNFEIVIIDDGSEDSTAEIVQNSILNDNRIHLYSQINKGVSAARNNALSHASGEYIMFVDGDDYIESNYLQTYFETAEEYKATVVVGGCTCINMDSSDISKIYSPITGDITDEIWLLLSEKNSVFGFVCSKIIKRDLIENNQIRYDESMYSQEDLNFNLDVYSKADRIIAIQNSEYVYEYRQSNRKPDTIGYIKNVLKLYNICVNKGLMNQQILQNIQNSLKSYCFGYLLYSDDKKQALAELGKIDNLKIILDDIKIRNEKDYVCSLFSHSFDQLIIMHFSFREVLKRITGRG